MPQKPASLFDSPGEHPVFSVSEFLDLINELLGASDLFVQGEVTKWNVHPKGVFFTLRDPHDGSVLEGYLSPWKFRDLGFSVEPGMLLKVGGVGNIWKARGTFSIRAESIEPFGEGSIKKAYDALKRKLESEGLFDRKRPLPGYVKDVGLITSKTGAVIDDFRRNLQKLGFRVHHRDVRVEGAGAAVQIVDALRAFDRGTVPVDVLVIIRGGGSLEDLQAFNSENVVRAVFGSRVPTVVSIGHDRDVPLAQMAADASASTPTAVAHLVNGTWSPLTERLPQLRQRLFHAFESIQAAAGADVRAMAERLAVHLSRIAGAGDLLASRLVRHLDRLGARIRQISDTVTAAKRQLESSDPTRLLRLGYSIVTDDSGAVVRSAADLRYGQTVSTRLARGSFLSEVKELQSSHDEE